VTIRGGITATIPGHPQPKGSLKCIGRRGKREHVLIEDNRDTGPYRAELVRWLRQTSQRGVKGQPVAVEITSTLARPKRHYGTGRNADRVRPAAPAYPTGHGTGDVDKLARLVLDALEDVGIVGDDAQIVEVVTRKCYLHDRTMPDALDFPGVVVRVEPYHP